MIDSSMNDLVSLDVPKGVSKDTLNDSPLNSFNIRQQNVRFLNVTSVDESIKLSSLNPFIIRKVIDHTAGKVDYVKKLASGDLLIKVFSASQVKDLQKMTQMHSYKVRVSVPRNLNTCRGVISCRDLKDMEEPEIVKCMDDQDVVGARIITRLEDTKRVRTNSVILTFSKAKVPEHVFVGYERISVRPYVPLPMRCFKCQKYGHGSMRCQSTKDICGRCSGEHDTKDCKLDPKCVNCGGAHTSFDRSCDRYKLEAEIVSYKVKEDVSFPEARKHIMSTSGKTPEPRVSYASRAAAKPQTCDAVCQTTFTAKPKQTVSFTISTATTGTSTSDSPTSPPTSSTSESSTPPPPPPSTIVAEPTQQQKSKAIDNENMTVLRKSNIPHLVVPVAPTRSCSLERTTSLDRLEMETTTTRGRTMSPANGDRRTSWSPKIKKHKKNRGTPPRNNR